MKDVPRSKGIQRRCLSLRRSSCSNVCSPYRYREPSLAPLWETLLQTARPAATGAQDHDGLGREEAQRAAAISDNLEGGVELVQARLEVLWGERYRPGNMTSYVLVLGPHVEHHDLAGPDPRQQLRPADPLGLAGPGANDMEDPGQPPPNELVQARRARRRSGRPPPLQLGARPGYIGRERAGTSTLALLVNPKTTVIVVNLGLSRRGDYVVRSAICLARVYLSERPTKLREVSSEMGVPRTFASQILGDLVRSGIAVSSFGLHGGYRLARPPEEVSLLDVIEAGEGSLASENCALADEPCPGEEVCPVHETWVRATSAFRRELAGTSLAQVASANGANGATKIGGWLVAAPRHPRQARAVSITDSVRLQLPFDVVLATLRGGGTWLAPHLAAVPAGAEDLRLRLGPAGPAWLGKAATVRLGKPDAAGKLAEVPLSWEATGPTGLFPRFQGTLRLIELGPNGCELALSGNYRPPLGRAGQALDGALLARVARATARSFLRRVAHGVEQAGAGLVPEEARPLAELNGELR
jgi:Rrf2 family iron-sulfur cluster assembly transcriptional regulator